MKELRSLGLFPDAIICRSSEMLTTAVKEKMSVFCHVGTGFIRTSFIIINQSIITLMTMSKRPCTVCSRCTEYLPCTIDPYEPKHT